MLYLNLDSNPIKFGMSPAFFSRELNVPDRVVFRAMQIQKILDEANTVMAQIESAAPHQVQEWTTEGIAKVWQIVEQVAGAGGPQPAGDSAEQTQKRTGTVAPTSTPSRSRSKSKA